MTLTEGKLRKWLKQVNTDCPEGKHWVIWHKANDCAFVCIIPPCHIKAVTNYYCLRVYTDTKAFSPFNELRKIYKEYAILEALNELSHKINMPPTLGFVVGKQVLFAVAAKEWVKWALEWEKKQ